MRVYLTRDQRDQVKSTAVRLLATSRNLTNEQLRERFAEYGDRRCFYNQSRTMGNCRPGTIDFAEEMFGDTRSRSIGELLDAIEKRTDGYRQLAIAAMCYAKCEFDYIKELQPTEAR